MKIKFSTPVNQDYQSIFSGFSEELFKELSPPGFKVKLLRLDGSKKGDKINFRLLFPGFSQDWLSLVTEYEKDLEEIYFIDQGIKLPFFLTYWKHKHRILKGKNYSVIIDEINFRTPFPLLDILIYPVMYYQFYYRKHIYKNVFG